MPFLVFVMEKQQKDVNIPVKFDHTLSYLCYVLFAGSIRHMYTSWVMFYWPHVCKLGYVLLATRIQVGLCYIRHTYTSYVMLYSPHVSKLGYVLLATRIQVGLCSIRHTYPSWVMFYWPHIRVCNLGLCSILHK